MPWDTDVMPLSLLQDVRIVTEPAGMGEFMNEGLLPTEGRSPRVLELT